MGLVTVARYERQVFYGTAGTTATTQILTLREVDLNFTHDYDPTDVRGDGTTIPLGTEQAVKRKCEIKFKTLHKKSDSVTTALLAAALHVSSPAIALKVVSFLTGAVLFDGDVILDVADPDMRELEFTAHPTLESGRNPVF